MINNLLMDKCVSRYETSGLSAQCSLIIGQLLYQWQIGLYSQKRVILKDLKDI